MALDESSLTQETSSELDSSDDDTIHEPPNKQRKVC